MDSGNNLVLKGFDNGLSQPLLDGQEDVIAVKTTAPMKSPNQQVENYLSGRIYASNAPKILLETITARTALLIIVLTYTFFIIGFALDFNTIYQGFNGSNKQIGALNCASQNLTLSSETTFWGCSNGRFWNSTVTHLHNVLSVKLNVQQTNITSLLPEMNSTFNIVYNVNIWACYNEGGCGTNFADNFDYSDDPNLWQQMLVQTNQVYEINLERDVSSINQMDGINIQIVSNTFQNQESIPTNGLVKSYYLLIEYISDPYNLFSGTDDTNAANTLYFYDVISRPQDTVVNALTVVLMIITISVLCLYSYVLLRQDKLLSEQKWVIAYFVLLIMFQNPVYLVIVWYSSPPTVTAAYTSYVVGYLAQSGLFILWLLFADSIQRKTNSKTIFYGPKIFIGLIIFTTGIVILTFQFPGLDPTDSSQRNAVEAVVNWSPHLKLDFIVFTVMYITLIWLWTIMWFVRLVVTGRRLNRLPYMSTRYIQLSYRFFFLQATLVTIYYVFQYCAVVYFISSGNSWNLHDYSPTSLTDNINTLFRQQTQLFGKTLFLTVYAIIIAFLFLPANLSENTGIVASLAATYVITESEHTTLTTSRLENIKSMNRNILNKVTRMNQLIHAKADVFCVDIALNLRNIAFQSYYDPPIVKTVSGYEGVMDVEKIGYTLIECHYNAIHEVFCFIVREKKTGRLVVCFRGTASKRQMEDNLNFKQKTVDFHSLSTATLNSLDNLSIKQEDVDQYDDDDLDSVDEEDAGEEDHNLLDAIADIETGFSMGRSPSSNGQNNGQQQTEDDRGDTFVERSTYIVDGVKNLFAGAVAGAVDVTNRGIDAVVGLSADVAVAAASKTPGLKGIVKVHVHSGFWDAYSHVRDFVHAILRRELVKTPTTVFFTGHSLGGALATYAALDFQIHTVPRVNAYLKHKERQMYGARIEKAPTILSKLLNIAQLPHTASQNATALQRSQGVINSPVTSEDGASQSASRMFSDQSGGSALPYLERSESRRGAVSTRPRFVKKIKTVMYNFGSPRVGNTAFAQLYDKEIPKTYRVVIDGDVVTGLPPSGMWFIGRGYQHIGTEILIDSTGSGSIIIDPSFVERWLRTHTKSSVAAHSLLVYRKGLLGIKLSAEFMKQRAVDYAKQDLDADPLRLALKVRGSIHIDGVFDYDNFESAIEDEPDISLSPPPLLTVKRDFIDEINNNELRMSNNGTRTDSVAIELQLSPKNSLEGSEKLPPSPPHTSPVLTRHQLPKMMSEQLVLTKEESKLIYNSDCVSPHTLEEDEKHYAHDVETMNDMMAQIQGMKKQGGSIKWLKNKTINRGKSSKGSSKHASQLFIPSSPSTSLSNTSTSPIAAMTVSADIARSKSSDDGDRERPRGRGISHDQSHLSHISEGNEGDEEEKSPSLLSTNSTGKWSPTTAVSSNKEKKVSTKRINSSSTSKGRDSPSTNAEFTSVRNESESD